MNPYEAILMIDEAMTPLACRIAENPKSAQDLMPLIDKLLDRRLVCMNVRDSQ